MNNGTANFTSATVPADLVNEIYEGYVGSLIDASMLALLSYTTILAVPQEMEYMWSRKYIGATSVFYAFTRYGSLIVQVLTFWLDNLPSYVRLCNILVNVQNVGDLLTQYVGVQGLLVSRAYSLCQGNRIVTGAFVFLLLAGLIVQILFGEANPDCFENFTGDNIGEILVIDICVCLTDVLAFCVCMWKVWVVIRHAVSRFGFVVTFTVALTILTQVLVSTPQQNTTLVTFSAMLLADFALDLRRQNSRAIRAANITLPTIQITSIMSYVHQSILVEMGDYENDQAGEGDGGDNPPAGPGSQDTEIQSESV